jgi:hypothetical protein
MADKELEHARFGYEEKDVNSVAITRFGIGLSLIIIVTLFALWGLFHYFVKTDTSSTGEVAPTVVKDESALKAPPQPRLQASPPIDLRDMRAAEDKLLHHYSWVDREKGVVRLPIDRAMDVLAARGLPSRPATEQPQGTTK